MAKLTEAIGVPYRLYPMSGSTLGEGLQGSHPVWRDSRPGLVARTLLSEPTANFLVVVDEIDKAADHGGSDPFRPFYGLLDRSNSVNFVDEFLGFPIDASAISWVATANDIADIPSAVLDRLMIIEVPEMDSRQRIIVARSIYADINARHGGYFDGQLPQSVVQRVLDINPRRCRIAIEDALIRAAADGRRLIEPEDVQPVKAVSKRRTALH